VKRAFDFSVALAGLVFLSPALLLIAAVIGLQDWRSPFYVAPRVGVGRRPFRMVKFRSMVIRADQSGVDSTSGDDPRITRIGRFVRRFKLDELPQLWNVLKGEMSLVGPRPNVEREVALYTEQERELLSVRPGITDLSSIVFADEAEILRGSEEPDLRYNQIIRPWKSRLGLLYVANVGPLWLDFRIIWLTARGAVDRETSLQALSDLVAELGGDARLRQVSRRARPLEPAPPPGATEVVRQRTPVVAA
jgi:lipopolysaccharide/colanic/teichoic acid biosynthesis glycosyltransferase